MALVTHDNYNPPSWLLNGHFDTIYPAFFRKISYSIPVEHTIIQTPDNDSFDLDFYDNKSNKTIIISHGLEGNSSRPYVIGMANLFFSNGWNVIAWNYRGCNGKINNSIKSYHSGFTEDLEVVIAFADTQNVQVISLLGFSLGGNLTLKYLGDASKVHEKIRNAVAFSVPLDLHKGCLEISKPSNMVYSKRFLQSLKKKVKEKALHFPEIKTKYLPEIRDLMAFDDHYTAPFHGFNDALDYYNSCSAIHAIEQINIPSLIVNAKNDPFLPIECYPYNLVKNHPFVHLQTPARGGHVGFCSNNTNGIYWSEKRALEFIESTV